MARKRRKDWMTVEEARRYYAEEDAQFPEDVRRAIEAGRTAKFKRYGEPVKKDDDHPDATT